MRMIRRIPVALLVAGLAGNFLSPAVETTPLPLVHPRVTTGESARLTSGFIENRGQWSGSARFAARRGSVAAALEPDRIRLRLDAADAATVELVFEGASSRVTLEGEEQRPGVYNFISGNIASAWQMNVPAFHSVIYRGMYAGVDVRLREQSRHFEYDLIVSPRRRFAAGGCSRRRRIVARSRC